MTLRSGINYVVRCLGLRETNWWKTKDHIKRNKESIEAILDYIEKEAGRVIRVRVELSHTKLGGDRYQGHDVEDRIKRASYISKDLVRQIKETAEKECKKDPNPPSGIIGQVAEIDQYIYDENKRAIDNLLKFKMLTRENDLESSPKQTTGMQPSPTVPTGQQAQPPQEPKPHHPVAPEKTPTNKTMTNASPNDNTPINETTPTKAQKNVPTGSINDQPPPTANVGGLVIDSPPLQAMKPLDYKQYYKKLESIEEETATAQGVTYDELPTLKQLSLARRENTDGITDIEPSDDEKHVRFSATTNFDSKNRRVSEINDVLTMVHDVSQTDTPHDDDTDDDDANDDSVGGWNVTIPESAIGDGNEDVDAASPTVDSIEAGSDEADHGTGVRQDQE